MLILVLQRMRDFLDWLKTLKYRPLATVFCKLKKEK
jgi:hypothetical protein